MDHLQYGGKKCHSVIPPTTTGIEEKPAQKKALAGKGF